MGILSAVFCLQLASLVQSAVRAHSKIVVRHQAPQESVGYRDTAFEAYSFSEPIDVF